MNNQQIYQQALDKFGIDNQLLVLIEEMAELTKEIIKKFRKKDDNFDKIKIYEELVDVKIMLIQVELFFQQQDEDYQNFIDKFIQEKTNRLQKRLNGKVN